MLGSQSHLGPNPSFHPRTFLNFCFLTCRMELILPGMRKWIKWSIGVKELGRKEILPPPPPCTALSLPSCSSLVCFLPIPVSLHHHFSAHTTHAYFLSNPIAFLLSTLRCYLNIAARLIEKQFNLSEVPGLRYEVWKVSGSSGDQNHRGLKEGLIFYHVIMTDIWNKARNIFLIPSTEIWKLI